jgi:hypothetical protein
VEPVMSTIAIKLLYCTLYWRKEENLIKNHAPFPKFQEINTEASSLRALKIIPRNLNEIVHLVRS